MAPFPFDLLKKGHFEVSWSISKAIFFLEIHSMKNESIIKAYKKAYDMINYFFFKKAEFCNNLVLHTVYLGVAKIGNFGNKLLEAQILNYFITIKNFHSQA